MLLLPHDEIGLVAAHDEPGFHLVGEIVVGLVHLSLVVGLARDLRGSVLYPLLERGMARAFRALGQEDDLAPVLHGTDGLRDCLRGLVQVDVLGQAASRHDEQVCLLVYADLEGVPDNLDRFFEGNAEFPGLDVDHVGPLSHDIDDEIGTDFLGALDQCRDARGCRRGCPSSRSRRGAWRGSR